MQNGNNGQYLSRTVRVKPSKTKTGQEPPSPTGREWQGSLGRRRSREPSQSSDWLSDDGRGGTENLKLAEKGRLKG